MHLQDNPAQKRYEAIDGNTNNLAGFAAYRDRAGSRVFTHTEVSEDYAGQGVAGELARYAVEHVKDAGYRLVPLCPFIAAWLKKHPEYDAVVDWPQSSAQPAAQSSAQPVQEAGK